MATVFYRLEEGPPDLRREMTLANFDMAAIDRDCIKIGCSLEAYMAAFVTRPGGVCDRMDLKPMSAAVIADTMRLAREIADMGKFYDQLNRAEIR